MNRFFYSLLMILALPLFWLRLVLRARRAPAYGERRAERFARPQSWPRFHGDSRLVMFHAVSVGEVHAAEPLIRRYLSDRPDDNVLVTTSTPTGSARVRALFGDSVLHVYLPYDLPAYMGRFMDHFFPSLVIILETELWPNLLAQAKMRGIPVALVNARLSQKSARGYARFRRLSHDMLDALALLCAQSAEDLQRFIDLGLAPERGNVVSSLKFDIRVPDDMVVSGRAARQEVFGERPVVIAASTREGEESIVLDAWDRVHAGHPGAALVLVPRHPERFAEVAALCRDRGYRVLEKSGWNGAAPADPPDILLGDSMGEMFFYFGMADIAFVGGSLVDTGCQNILEPAALSLPVVTGPSLFNFRMASNGLQQAGGMRVVTGAEELAAVLGDLLQNQAGRRAAGVRAGEYYASQSGAVDTLFRKLEKLA